MRTSFGFSTLILLGMLILPSVPAKAYDPSLKGQPWTGKLADGTIITREDLSRILADHKKWLESDKKEGKQANLSRAD